MIMTLGYPADEHAFFVDWIGVWCVALLGGICLTRLFRKRWSLSRVGLAAAFAIVLPVALTDIGGDKWINPHASAGSFWHDVRGVGRLSLFPNLVPHTYGRSWGVGQASFLSGLVIVGLVAEAFVKGREKKILLVALAGIFAILFYGLNVWLTEGTFPSFYPTARERFIGGLGTGFYPILAGIIGFGLARRARYSLPTASLIGAGMTLLYIVVQIPYFLGVDQISLRPQAERDLMAATESDSLLRPDFAPNWLILCGVILSVQAATIRLHHAVSARCSGLAS